MLLFWIFLVNEGDLSPNDGIKNFLTRRTGFLHEISQVSLDDMNEFVAQLVTRL